jgi:hypothetical protein
MLRISGRDRRRVEDGAGRIIIEHGLNLHKILLSRRLIAGGQDVAGGRGFDFDGLSRPEDVRVSVVDVSLEVVLSVGVKVAEAAGEMRVEIHLDFLDVGKLGYK